MKHKGTVLLQTFIKHKGTVLLLIAVSCIISCTGERHFLKDATYRARVEEQFARRKTLAAGRSEALFAILDRADLSTEQAEALKFLYAYMPLSDLADYDGDFFLSQVDGALRARDFFAWGKTVPEDIFRHFVLVYRVNNENLDTARTVFFNELKDRVAGLSMADAAMEVNHWCHEKVCYRGTDSRTSAPLATVRTSWGRCGEESTFTTTALRAVGIPARQCYTPRWVHTDDNHAWVEVWIDGQWHFMGACEPEAELDAGWFAGPAKRAMMVHTNVFGYYDGPEEKNLETPLYSKINLLANYAETRTATALVIDENNRPVENAKLDFMVYNYAEYYPVSTARTDKNGRASILTGHGDLMLWASLGNSYGYSKSATGDSLTTIRLDRKAGDTYSEIITMEAPAEQPTRQIDPDKVAANGRRLAIEDSIRNAYMQTFISHDEALDWAVKENINPDKTWSALSRSQGNWREIKNFIASEKNDPHLFDFLASLSEKDLRDTPANFLREHLEAGNNLAPAADNLIVPFVLSPRIELELIRPWRKFFIELRNNEDRAAARENPALIIDWINRNIKINEEENYYNCPISPRGTYELGTADRRSRNIFFVAVCRAFGIPAKVEAATGKPQYFAAGEWIDAAFDSDSRTDSNTHRGNLTVKNSATNVVKPGYYSHYTIARFSDGGFQTLDYENSADVATFPYTLSLDSGYYRLMTGSRTNDGSVVASTHYFNIEANSRQTVEVELPSTENRMTVKGIIDMNTAVTLADGEKKSLKELSQGKGLFLCFVDPGKEPSKHILQDIPAVGPALEEWGGGALFVIPGAKNNEGFDPATFKGLPQQTQWSVDNDSQLLTAAASALNLDLGDNFPLTLYLTDNGGILFSATGYRIGTGEDVLKTIRLEEKIKY